MDKFRMILNRCKCGVFLTVNEHRDYYQTVEERIEELEINNEIENDIKRKMIELDTIIDLQFYPDTPIGSYSIYHYDLDKALDEAVKVFK